MPDTSKTLYAFYDLSVSTPKFDFLNFAQIADLHRKRHSFDFIHFVFVPGPKNGFRDSPSPPTDPDVLSGMMRNIVLPGCWLLPACSGVSYLSARDEADAYLARCNGNQFPRGYRSDAPISDNLWGGMNTAVIRGEKLTPFRAPKEYRDQAAEYCRMIAGDRKLLIITMRECDYYPKRNSDMPEWKKFIDYLDASKYAVLVVRDTAKAHHPPLFDGVPECPLASINILFRAAISEQAYMNLHVANGAGCPALFSLVPAVSFGGLEGTDHYASTAEFLERFMGIGSGDQLLGFPEWTRYIWEKDTFDVIKAEFELTSEIIDRHGGECDSYHDLVSESHRNFACNTIVDYVFSKMQVDQNDEDRDALLKVIERTDGKHAVAINLLGIWYSNAGQAELAVEAFRNAVQADPGFITPHLNLAQILENLGRKPEALDGYALMFETCGITKENADRAIACAMSIGDQDRAKSFISMAEAAPLSAEEIGSLKQQLP